MFPEDKMFSSTNFCHCKVILQRITYPSQSDEFLFKFFSKKQSLMYSEHSALFNFLSPFFSLMF